MELLTEIGLRPYGSGNRSFGLFKCPVCGIEIEKSLSHGKRDKNCGDKECRKATFSSNPDVAVKLIKHGFSADPYFRTFTRMYDGMKQRCYNKNHTAYKYYGGKGITICDRWLDMSLFAKDMFPKYKYMMESCDGSTADRPSIDRIDPFGNYEPSNCQWIRYGDNSVKDKTIPVVRMDMNNNILETYCSMAEAAKFESVFGSTFMKANAVDIGRCCSGKSGSHVGYKWAYATNKESMKKHRII